MPLDTQDKQEMEVLVELCFEMVQMTSAQQQLIAEACVRCDLSPAEFLLKSALAEARRIVPKACRPAAVKKALPGFFAQGETDES